MQTSVEVRYAGVVVARAEEVRKGDATGMALFLRLAEPMPVGTTLELRAEGSDTTVIVERVFESSEARIAGMFVRLQDANAAWAVAVATSPDDTEGIPTPLLTELSRSKETRTGDGYGAVTERSGPVPAAISEPSPTFDAALAAPSTAEPDAPAITIPSALASASPTVSTDDGSTAAARAAIVQPVSEGTGSRKTLMYYGTDTPAAPSEEKREDLPPARAVPLPDGRRRTTKQRRRK